MSVQQRIRDAEDSLFARYSLKSDESYIDLPSTKLRLRVLSVGSGPDLVMLHGASLAAAIWAPWLNELRGYRALLVELPGHGLSDPVTYRVGSVRAHTIELLDDLFESLGLAAPSVVGHSLGGMFALWHAAERPGRIASLVAIGDPGAALPGVQVRMPLSLLTVPGLGRAVLSSPSPRSTYRQILGQGLSSAAARSMPDELVDILRLARRRKGNPRTVASLMHAIDGFRRPRPETPMSDSELARIDVPTMFCLGREDPFLSPHQARRSVAKIPGALLHEVAGGHAPWFENPSSAPNCSTTTRELRELFPPEDIAGWNRLHGHAPLSHHYRRSEDRAHRPGLNKACVKSRPRPSCLFIDGNPNWQSNEHYGKDSEDWLDRSSSSGPSRRTKRTA
jgi:pimeloyl-ACP methyl ester carboxylesterase